MNRYKQEREKENGGKRPGNGGLEKIWSKYFKKEKESKKKHKIGKRCYKLVDTKGDHFEFCEPPIRLLWRTLGVKRSKF